MQRRQRVVRHLRIHVMLHMIVHVPVDEARDRVHHHGTRVQPMVGDVVGKAAMLQHAGHHMVPGAIEARRAYQKQRQPALHHHSRADGGGIDQHPDPGDPHHLVMLAVRDIGGFLRIKPARGVDQHQPQPRRDVQKPEEVGHEPGEFRRSHQLYFGIAADDDGVGMMPRVAPSPGMRIADHAETGDLIDNVVHPACLEGCLVAAFMPAGIHRRAV